MPVARKIEARPYSSAWALFKVKVKAKVKAKIKVRVG